MLWRWWKQNSRPAKGVSEVERLKLGSAWAHRSGPSTGKAKASAFGWAETQRRSTLFAPTSDRLRSNFADKRLEDLKGLTPLPFT